MDEDIKKLIKNELESGSTRDHLISNLIFAGFDFRDINRVLNKMEKDRELPDGWNDGQKRDIRHPMFMRVKKIQEKLPENVESKTGFGYVKKEIGKFKILIISLAIIILLAILGAGYWYFSYYMSPEKVVVRAVEKIGSFRAFEFISKQTSKINNQIEPISIWDKKISQSSKIVLDTQGVIDLKNADNFKWSLVHSIKNEKGESIWDGQIIKAQNQNLWFYKINKLGDFGNEATTTYAFANLAVGQWISVEPQDSQDNLKEIMPTYLLSGIDSLSRTNAKWAIKALETFAEQKTFDHIIKMSPEIINKIEYDKYSFDTNIDQITKYKEFIQSTGGMDLFPFDNQYLYNSHWTILINKQTELIYKIEINPTINDSNKSILFNPQKIELYIWNINAVNDFNNPSQALKFSKLREIFEEEQNSLKTTKK